MRVTLSFLGPLRDQLGEPSLVVELPEGASYRDLLDSIAGTMQTRLAGWVWDSEKRSFRRQIMVSRNASAELRDETAILADGDELLVFPPLSGG